ncbi:PIG-L family deacetylase [Micromonospora sp. WMMD1102]|uniref:PIG-L deacetylase family protein n=1 Tax=Micromonospora sp. WMMD1102 TaxID=3016105 RepID=UPI0024150158|nr:PIG-L family deacetylase [Micromonospora sp. WMMD1102]MDG4785923.1 PIG-L family deacetylase [Micromonospora sp. WMMD1102]
MRVLAVAAHPDDLEQLCGGTLARFAAEGHEVTMCHVSRGDRGSYVNTMEEIAAIRFAEAGRAAAVIGATHVTMGVSDGEVNAADPAQRTQAVEIVRRARPDLLLTHHPHDYMPDHVETGRLFEEASFIATLPLYETAAPHHPVVPAVYYMDTLASVNFVPTEYVDVSSVIQVKLDALAEHCSQVEWLRDHDGVDVIEQTRTLTAARGYQCGVAYAEGFLPSLRWLRPRTVRMLP